MSENAAKPGPGTVAKVATPILVIAAIAIAIVFDPLAAVVHRLDLGSLGWPDMPGWVDWIGDLPGPGLLIVFVVLIVLGEWGRRGNADLDDKS